MLHNDLDLCGKGIRKLGMGKRAKSKVKKLTREKSITELSGRHLRYAELLAEGSLSQFESCVRAGFARGTAQSCSFIGEDREHSDYPQLYDYFLKLRQERLKTYDVTPDRVVEHLRAIAFSDITDFLLLPTREQIERRIAQDDRARRAASLPDASTGQDMEAPTQAASVESGTQGDQEIDAQDKFQAWLPGSAIRLKCLDDIPKELRGAIASIKEGRYGIELRLHDKLDALDKLARYLRMYDGDRDLSRPTEIKSFEINVNGSKSRLLDGLLKGGQGE